jgi:uncharacterized protein with PIN domain
VGLVILNGQPVCGDPILADGDRLSIFPHFALLGLPAVCETDTPPRFIADVHLGTLVRRLRLAGLDCLYHHHCDDPELARISRSEGRILLTRDRGLLMRREVERGILILSDGADEQILEVIDRLNPVPDIKPYTRCLECNGILSPISKDQALDEVPEYVALNHESFNRCQGCGRTFWSGTHKSMLDSRLEKIMRHAAHLRDWANRMRFDEKRCAA